MKSVYLICLILLTLACLAGFAALVYCGAIFGIVAAFALSLCPALLGAFSAGLIFDELSNS